jgi:hypothetical protein
VRKYVVVHQNTWSQGNALLDVTGDSAEAFDVDAVQGFCTNESPWLVWPRQRLVAGCYDCVIDVNANGVYDVGTDFVDNIDSLGDPTTCGMRVSDMACGDFITVTSHSNGQSVDATAITLEGTFEAEPTSAKVTVTSGTQANTVDVGVTGTEFSAVLPLFHGENILTLSAVKANGVACAETFKITSTASTSSEQLFQAQLTWDAVDQDMDLHLVKPGGTYANGGWGDGTDCNFGNCKVLDDNGNPVDNNIDWGKVGESDDPKLDVDCISDCSRIENIWMNEINQDGAYKVYVDAYTGSATAVNVAIFIRGAQVSTVACGAMAEDTATDSCFVGTISWSGGSGGNGTFTASGTKGATF